MHDVIEWAVTNYWLAKERATQGFARSEGCSDIDHEDWDTWTDQAQGVFNDAEARLISTVLIACGRIRRHYHMSKIRNDMESCCLDHDGTFYVVSYDVSTDDVPRLTVVLPSEIKADRRAKQ